MLFKTVINSSAKTFNIILVILTMAVLSSSLSGCATTPRAADELQETYLTSDDFSRIRSRPHGELVLQVGFIPHSVLWDERVSTDGYFLVVGPAHFDRRQTTVSQANNRLSPPFRGYPARVTRMRWEEHYVEPEIDSVFNFSDPVAQYFNQYDNYELVGNPPTELIREQMVMQPPALVITARNTDTGEVSGAYMHFTATERGQEIVADDDFRFLAREDAHSLYWRPYKQDASLPLPPGNYEIRYRLLTYDVIPTRYGVIETIVRLLFGTATMDYTTVVHVDGTETLRVDQGDLVSLTLRDVSEGVVIANEGE